MTATDWRHPGERRELVEQLIAAEKRARIAEAKARDLLVERGLEVPDDVTRLAVRCIDLEDMVKRQNRTIVELNLRLARRKAG